MSRPKLTQSTPLEEYKNHYWLKEELISFCKEIGINRTGSKGDISKRVELFLQSGEIISKVINEKKSNQSTFDWNNEPLTHETIITDNYKNSENVRTFFKRSINNNFKFNVTFMNWMKQNSGKTLNEAISAYKEIKKSNCKMEINPQFEYNRYIRDFLDANRTLTTKDAIYYWNKKRSLPVPKKYNVSDLDL